MKAERPALGISRSSVYDDAVVYHVECSCTDPDHAVDAWVEISNDEDIPEVEVTFYIQTNFYGWRKFHQRLADAWRVLWGGSSERHHSLLLNKQAACNFAAAIEASIEDLESK